MPGQAVSAKPHERECVKPFGRGAKLQVEGINLIGRKVKCDSEDGELKAVLVHPPDYLAWTNESAINDVQRSNLPPSQEQVKKEHGMLVEALQNEGAQVVYVMPRPDLPEGVYQRDSLGVIGDNAFAAKFKYPVRSREVSLICGAKAPWKGNDVLEFGDVLVFPDAVLVGLGDRTNMPAVETLRQALSGREVIPVPLRAGTLHLDYATTVGGRGKMRTMVVCHDLYADQGQIGALKKRLHVRNVIGVPEKEHLGGWTNLFFVNPETVISTTSARAVNEQLRKIGFKVIDIPFEGILTGEGAPRCCTAPLWREG
ncbi:MAG: arginine deiminase family protein [Candidatus Micrarchaeota archaeon]